MTDAERFEAALRQALKPRRRSYSVTVPDHYSERQSFGEWSGAGPVDHADPIFTPIFTAILGAGGFGLSGTMLTWAAGVASAIATTSVIPGKPTVLA